MSSPKKKPTTYRLTPELDQIITRKAAKLGLSKNAFVQLILSQTLGQKEDTQNNDDSAPNAANQ